MSSELEFQGSLETICQSIEEVHSLLVALEEQVKGGLFKVPSPAGNSEMLMVEDEGQGEEEDYLCGD
jgi:hypothetical protein